MCVGAVAAGHSVSASRTRALGRRVSFTLRGSYIYVIFILFSSAEVTYCIVTLVADRAPLSLHFGGAALFAFNKCVESRDISERGGICAREVRDLHLSALSLYYY